MSLKLTARIDSYGPHGYYAHIESIKGMGEYAPSPEGAIGELLISLKVKMAYDLGIDIDGLRESVVAPLEMYKIEKTEFEEKGYAEKEIDLQTLVA